MSRNLTGIKSFYFKIAFNSMYIRTKYVNVEDQISLILQAMVIGMDFLNNKFGNPEQC